MVRAMCLASALAMAVWIWLSPLAHAQTTSADRLIVHSLDAGTADATWIQLSDLSTVVVLECGSQANGRQLVSSMIASGVQRIDVLAPTSALPDVVGGCTEVLQSLPVAQVWLTGQTDDSASWHNFSVAMQAQSLQPTYWSSASGPVAWGANLTATAYNPQPKDPSAPHDDYDDSLAVGINFGGANLVVLGALAAAGQANAVAAGLAPAEVLKATSRGAAQLPSSDVLSAVRPQNTDLELVVARPQRLALQSDGSIPRRAPGVRDSVWWSDCQLAAGWQRSEHDHDARPGLLAGDTCLKTQRQGQRPPLRTPTPSPARPQTRAVRPTPSLAPRRW